MQCMIKNSEKMYSDEKWKIHFVNVVCCMHLTYEMNDKQIDSYSSHVLQYQNNDKKLMNEQKREEKKIRFKPTNECGTFLCKTTQNKNRFDRANEIFRLSIPNRFSHRQIRFFFTSFAVCAFDYTQLIKSFS